MEIRKTPKPIEAYTFDSAPEVSVFVDRTGRVTIAGRTLANNKDALRVVHAILGAYAHSLERWLYTDDDA